MKKLILFDIDGTLINPGNAGAVAMSNAFLECFSIENAFSGMKMAGRTDIGIINEGLARHNILATEDIYNSILETYICHLLVTIKNDNKHLYPGVRELLKTLSGIKDFTLGLLTGNIEKGARIKLQEFDLNGYFPEGAFGSDHEDRNCLLPIAVEKFRKLTHMDFSYIDCIVIGDTPSDIQCAKPYGALSVAVSTGSFSFDALLDAGADYVLKNLTELLGTVKDLKPVLP